MEIQKSLVLISNPRIDLFWGTGFLIQFNGRLLVVTLRHVLNASGKGSFALTNVRQTYDPPGGYKVLPIVKLYNHREDSTGTKFDICVCEAFKIPNKEYNFVPITINERMNFKEPEQGDKVSIFGYPTAHVEPAFERNMDIPLKPFEIQGVVRTDLPVLQWDRIDCKELQEAFLAQTDRDLTLPGICGGLVIHNNIPYGVVLGEAKYSISNENHYGIVFAKFSRIMEILQTLKN